MNTYVVREHTHDSDEFDPVKLHGSVLRACMAVRTFEGEAHAIAERVCKHVIDWLADKTEVSSRDIRRITAQHIATYHTSH
jgi:hypothetical protein